MVRDQSNPKASQVQLWVVGLAIAVPLLLAVNLPPSPTLLNQCASVGLWGAAAVALSFSHVVTGPLGDWRATALPGGALGVIVAGAAVSAAWSLPFGIAGSLAAIALCAWIVAVFGCAQAGSSNTMLVFFGALLVAGAISAVIGCLQAFAPSWADGDLIARTPMPGRAVGNLRQPNHLGSLLLWALIALVALAGSRRLHGVACALGSLLIFAIVLTGSRTSLLGVGVLALWGLFDRTLQRRVRMALISSPLVLAAMWIGMVEWAHATGHAFGSEGRLSIGHGDISSSRFAIWSNALSMTAREPWTGVGLGEFNLAWTLTALPDRPTAYFDHAHNLPLQLLVELGIPAGSLVVVLLLAALVQAGRRAWACEAETGLTRRAAFMMVLMIGLHSMLEYPLWYSYFLLPTAFAWGFALSSVHRPEASPGGAATYAGGTAVPLRAKRGPRTLALTGIAMTIGAAAATLDYWNIVVIYEPPENAAPLEERIARGQRSPLFGHHADYAAATAFGPPKAPLSPSQELAFRRAPHQLLDVRLMIAWSQALAAQGELDKARWLAARIREFRNPGADEYFAPCQDAAQAAQAFQCQPPTREVQWREFTRR